jgi:hypothetical protein
MIRKLLIAGLALSAALAGCASEPPTAGELLAFEAVCDKANDGKRVAVEGYLLLPDEFTDSESVVLRLYQELDLDEARIGVTVRFGSEANQIDEVPTPTPTMISKSTSPTAAPSATTRGCGYRARSTSLSSLRMISPAGWKTPSSS